ncbi:MAG: Lysine 6-dehydrogenase [Calditrichaeota bacterium]|nr:Lysine 6-dehydrogenase [Calditrichota bacterium]
MANVLVLGAGRQGTAAAHDLLRDGDRVTLADGSDRALAGARERLGVDADRCRRVDFHDLDSLAPLFDAHDGAVFAADYSLNLELTRLAITNRCHCVDYGGNHDVVNRQHELDDQAKRAGVAIVPDCGLTPGLAGILVAGGIASLGGEAERAAIRVGGLPLEPAPPLNYALVFSVRGLTNEYLEESVVIEDGATATRPSLTGLETVTIGGREFEAFYTSGGVSTLPRSFAGSLRNLDCKTLRYPGHAERFRFLFELGFRGEEPVEACGGRFVPREALEAVLERALPHDPPDEVLLRVTVESANGHRIEYEMRDVYDTTTGFTAMQRTTAWPGSRIMRMLLDGTIAERGVLYQERAVDAGELVRKLAERGVRVEETKEPKSS